MPQQSAFGMGFGSERFGVQSLSQQQQILNQQRQQLILQEHQQLSQLQNVELLFQQQQQFVSAVNNLPQVREFNELKELRRNLQMQIENCQRQQRDLMEQQQLIMK